MVEPLDLAVRCLAHEDQVDQTDRVVLPKAIELRTHLPVELGLGEADHQQLNWSDGGHGFS